MKQILKRGLAILAACGAGFCQPSLAAPELVLEPIKVSEHVYYFGGEASMANAANKGFMSNAGFAVTSDGVVVFDALGTPPLGKAMVEAIKTVTDQPLRRVILSHYHADHVYGLQALKQQGVEIWAHQNGQDYPGSDEARERLAQRKADLAPWVDNETHVVSADRWLDFSDGNAIPFTMGDMHFRIIDASGAHSPEDIMLYVEDDRVLFSGDLFFTGRIPFVGTADSKSWLTTLDSMLEVHPRIVVPGHGRASTTPETDMQLTRDYLLYLRHEMGAAVEEMATFEEAYEQTDWSRFASYPAFEDANRINAYGTYLLMERESLDAK
jgi:glyoxylase-like metal-dependent hydrolase (beta-lactamase superfamily II)